MSPRIPHPCKHPGCPALVTEGGYCPAHARPKASGWRSRPTTRSTPTSARAWRELRALVLAQEPTCRVCGAVAVVVDHIVPVFAGGAELERDNLQALCKKCHAIKTARQRRPQPKGQDAPRVPSVNPGWGTP